MSKSEKDSLYICLIGHGCRIISPQDEAKNVDQRVEPTVNPSRDHSASPLTFAEDMKIGDKYVVWDGNDEEPFTEATEDMLRHQCMIMSNGELISISEMLAVIHKNPLVVPIIVFACKDGQVSKDGFNGKQRGPFSYFWNALLRRESEVTFRDAISLVNIAMQQEGLEQRAEVICRTDILEMPMMDISLPNEVPCTMIVDMCRTELTLAEFERDFKDLLPNNFLNQTRS